MLLNHKADTNLCVVKHSCYSFDIFRTLLFFVYFKILFQAKTRVTTWVCLESLWHYLLYQLLAKMYLAVNEDDLSVQEHAAWIVLHNSGYYSNTSVVLGSYSTISYFIFRGLFVNILKLAYHLKTLMEEFFTTVLFNVVVMATIRFSWYFTYEKAMAVYQVNKERKMFIYFCFYKHGTI